MAMKTTVSSVISTANYCIKRNYGISAVLLQKAPTDPIQKLFLDKLRAYRDKSKTSADGFVDSTPETKKQLDAELHRVARIHGLKPGEDVTKFPSFAFKDPQIDPISSSQ